jgi:CysZ protein
MSVATPLLNFVKGFCCPFNSFTFVRRHPRLYPFIVLPFAINVLSFCLVIYFGFDFYREQVMARIPHGDAWYWLILNYFLLLLAIVVVLVLIFFTFAAVGSLLASPFNDLLSERTSVLLGYRTAEEPFAVVPFLRTAGQTMVTECKKIGLFLLGMALLLLLHLLPVVGTLLYPLLSVAWTIFFLVMEYTGYVFARRRLGFNAQRQIVFRNAALMAGFGLGLFSLLAIPLVQFFCIPLGVVGAVRLLAEIHELGEPSTSAEQ